MWYVWNIIYYYKYDTGIMILPFEKKNFVWSSMPVWTIDFSLNYTDLTYMTGFYVKFPWSAVRPVRSVQFRKNSNGRLHRFVYNKGKSHLQVEFFLNGTDLTRPGAHFQNESINKLKKNLPFPNMSQILPGLKELYNLGKTPVARPQKKSI